MAAVGVVGARELAAQLATAAAGVDALMATVVVKAAADTQALIQQNASGRPGPNAPTGDYRGSWAIEVTARRAAVGTEISVSVGTDRAQANRLEYGFVGTDAIGRTFDQPPFPHMGPAVDVIEPVFHAAMEAVGAQALPW